MHRTVEVNGFVFVGGTIADGTSVSMSAQTRRTRGERRCCSNTPARKVTRSIYEPA